VIHERREALEARCRNEGYSSIEEMLESTDQKLDFLDILLCATGADGQPLPYQEILDEVNTFMVGCTLALAAAADATIPRWQLIESCV